MRLDDPLVRRRPLLLWVCFGPIYGSVVGQIEVVYAIALMAATISHLGIRPHPLQYVVANSNRTVDFHDSP